MENIVYCLGQWESEFICHRGDDLSDFKWFFSPEGEFLGGIMEFQVFFFPFISSWSIMTMMESKDPLGGRSVIRSTETCWKGWVQLDSKGERAGMVGWVLTLFAWQMAQPAIYL